MRDESEKKAGGSNIFFVLASAGGFLAVAIGAFGAHGLRASLAPEAMAVFETGVRYQMYHSFALFLPGWALKNYPARFFTVSGWCFVGGIVLFSGSLYLLATTGVRAFGAVTPFGGLAFLAGWLALGVGFWKARTAA